MRREPRRALNLHKDVAGTQFGLRNAEFKGGKSDRIPASHCAPDLHDYVAGTQLARVVRRPAEDHLVDLEPRQHDADLTGAREEEQTRQAGRQAGREGGREGEGETPDRERPVTDRPQRDQGVGGE